MIYYDVDMHLMNIIYGTMFCFLIVAIGGMTVVRAFKSKFCLNVKLIYNVLQMEYIYIVKLTYLLLLT